MSRHTPRRDVVFAGSGDTLWVGAANAILTSRDRGASWTMRPRVEGEVSLIVDPSNASRGVASPYVVVRLRRARCPPPRACCARPRRDASWQDIRDRPRATPQSPGCSATIAADGTFYVSTYTTGAYSIAASSNGGASFASGVGRAPHHDRVAAGDVRRSARFAPRAGSRSHGGTLLRDARRRRLVADARLAAHPRWSRISQTTPIGRDRLSSDAIVVAPRGSPAARRAAAPGRSQRSPTRPSGPTCARLLALRAAPDGRCC